jgi:hypothetical protein
MKCKYCNKEIQNKGSLINHQNNQCKLNPNYVYVFKTRIMSPETLKKIRHNNEKLKGKSYIERYGEEKAQEIKKKLRTHKKTRNVTEKQELERRKKISKTMKNNPDVGGLREGSGRGVKQWYVSPIAGKVYLRSSYEIEYAKWLDNNNIQWKQNLIKFPYEWKNEIRFYYPDFYLIDLDKYVEIKGYKTEKDIAKWKNFPFELEVLFKQDLLKLGLNVK